MALINRGKSSGNPWNKAPMSQLFGEGLEALTDNMKKLSTPLGTKAQNSVMAFTKSMDKFVDTLTGMHNMFKSSSKMYLDFSTQFKRVGDFILAGLKTVGGLIMEWIKSTKIFQASSAKLNNLFDSMGESGKKMKGMFEHVADLTKRSLGSLNMDEIAAIIKHQDKLLSIAKFAMGVGKPSADKAIGGLFGGLGHGGMFGGGAVGGDVSETLRSMAKFAPELSILFTLFEHSQFQDKMRNLTRSFGGYGKDFDSVTSSVMMLQSKIPMTSDELIALTEGFQDVGVNVRSANKDFQPFLETSANAVHMMGLSSETTSLWARAVDFSGGKVNDLKDSFAGLYEGVIKNNLGFKMFDAIAQESLGLWNNFGGIVHESLQQFSKDLIEATTNFRALNIDAKEGMQMIQSTLGDPDLRARQASLLTAMGHGGIMSNLELLEGASGKGQEQVAEAIYKLVGGYGTNAMNRLSMQKAMLSQGAAYGIPQNILTKIFQQHQMNPGQTLDQIQESERRKQLLGANPAQYDAALGSFNHTLSEVMQKFTNLGQSLTVLFGGPIFKLISPILDVINGSLNVLVTLMQQFPGVIDTIVYALLAVTGISVGFKIISLAGELKTFGIAIGGIGKAFGPWLPDFLKLSKVVGPVFKSVSWLVEPLLTLLGMDKTAGVFGGFTKVLGMGAKAAKIAEPLAPEAWLAARAAAPVVGEGLVAGGMMGGAGAVLGGAATFLVSNPVGWAILIVGALVATMFLLFPKTTTKMFTLAWELYDKIFIKPFTETLQNWVDGVKIMSEGWEKIKNDHPEVKAADMIINWQQHIPELVDMFFGKLDKGFDEILDKLFHREHQLDGAAGLHQQHMAALKRIGTHVGGYNTSSIPGEDSLNADVFHRMSMSAGAAPTGKQHVAALPMALAEASRSVAATMGGIHSLHRCEMGVERALKQVGIKWHQTDAFLSANAMAHDPRFTEVTGTNQLPGDMNVYGPKGRHTSGHIEVVGPDGIPNSDFHGSVNAENYSGVRHFRLRNESVSSGEVPPPPAMLENMAPPPGWHEEMLQELKNANHHNARTARGIQNLNASSVNTEQF